MVEREAKSVSLLVRNLQTYISQSKSQYEFAESTDKFFNYITKACKDIEKYIENILTIIGNRRVESTFQSGYENAWSSDLKNIKTILCHFHDIIINASESNILSVPFPFVALLNRIIKNIPNTTEETNIVIMNSDVYNFLYHTMWDIRRINAPHIFDPFPQNLGFISFPLIESKDILKNCVLFHELGHYVHYVLKVDEEIINKFPHLLTAAPDKLQKRGWQIISHWAAEIFCDFLASRLIGPAYLYNFWLLQYSLPLKELESFDVRHPAFLYRLSKMCGFLKREEWLDSIKKHTPEVDKWLNEHCGVEGGDYSLTQELINFIEPTEGFCQQLVREFNDKVVPFLDTRVKEVTNQVAASKDDFDKNHEAIMRYLEHFIVPSVLVDEDGKQSIPTHSTILTTATIFYLTSIDKWKDLFEYVPGDTTLEQHAYFYKKLNDFVLKSMVDLLILRRDR